jgi:hypothetical protein
MSWQQPLLSQTQQDVMSIDLRSVQHASWSRFVFPTVLLVLAVVGELLSTIGLVVLIGGLLASLITWLLCSAMLMWPLHRHIYLERETSLATLRVLKAATWGTYGLVWLALSGALLLFLAMSLPLAMSWGFGIGTGVTLALWQKPLATNSPFWRIRRRLTELQRK